MKRSSLLFLLSFIVINQTHAGDLTCSKSGTAIIYVNGVDNQEEDAANSIFEVEKLNLKTQLDKKSKVSYTYSYNDSHGAQLDFIEATAQKLRELTGVSRDDSYYYVSAFINGGMGLLPPAIRFYLSYANLDPSNINFSELVTYETEDTNELKNLMLDELATKKKKLIVISHSQGNLFINSAFEELSNQFNNAFIEYEKVLGNLQVASPADSILIQKSEHITNDVDAILSTPSSLPANFVLGSPLNTPTDPRPEDDQERNHSFIDTYLSNKHPQLLALREATSSKLIDVAKKLETNCGLPPVAAFNYLIDSSDSLMVHFNGTSSYDPEMRPLIYSWNFGDGATATGATPSHTYSSSGIYRVTLKVIDEDENESENIATMDIVVSADACGQVLVGCSEFGGSFGKLYANPDGSCGGFVAYGVTISPGMYLSPDSQICGNSVIPNVPTNYFSNVKINNSTVVAWSTVGTRLENVTIENSSVTGPYEGTYITNSKIKNTSILVTFMMLFIQDSQVYADVTAPNVGIVNSTINAPVTATDNIYILNSTINTPQSGTDVNLQNVIR